MQAHATITYNWMRNHNIYSHFHVNLAGIDTEIPFGTALEEDMFQRKIDDIFKEIPNIFSIAYDISIVG